MKNDMKTERNGSFEQYLSRRFWYYDYIRKTPKRSAPNLTR